MYAIYDDIYHQYTPNVSIYTSTMDPMGYITHYNMGIFETTSIKCPVAALKGQPGKVRPSIISIMPCLESHVEIIEKIPESDDVCSPLMTHKRIHGAGEKRQEKYNAAGFQVFSFFFLYIYIHIYICNHICIYIYIYHMIFLKLEKQFPAFPR